MSFLEISYYLKYIAVYNKSILSIYIFIYIILFNV